MNNVNTFTPKRLRLPNRYSSCHCLLTMHEFFHSSAVCWNLSSVYLERHLYFSEAFTHFYLSGLCVIHINILHVTIISTQTMGHRLLPSALCFVGVARTCTVYCSSIWQEAHVLGEIINTSTQKFLMVWEVESWSFAWVLQKGMLDLMTRSCLPLMPEKGMLWHFSCK